MRIRRGVGWLAVAFALGGWAFACVSDESTTPIIETGDASDEGVLCPLGNEGCGCTSGGSCNPGLSCASNLCVSVGGSDGGPGADGSMGSTDAGAVDACALGACSPVLVTKEPGLGTLDHLELRGTTLYGTNSGGMNDAGQVWRSETAPGSTLTYLTSPQATDMYGTGGLALDTDTAWFGNVGSDPKAVYKTPLSGDGGATFVSSSTVPVVLGVDSTYWYGADGANVGIVRELKAGGGNVVCTNTGSAVVNDIVTDAKGNVYWSGSLLGRASADQVTTWKGGNTCATSPITGIDVAGLGLDANNLYLSNATNGKIERMPLISCVKSTCQSAAKNCGQAPDGCGAIFDCGPCSGPSSCGGGGTPNTCGVGTCVPKTCAQLPQPACGLASDGCGLALDCGGCAAPKWCGGGGVPNACGGSLQDLSAKVTLPAAASPDAPKHLVSDGTKVYWGHGGGNIFAIKADGSSTSVQQILLAPSMNVGAIAVDAMHVYFTDNASHQVYRVPK